MRIRIEGAGHCVEIEHADTNKTPTELAELAEKVWTSTRVDDRRMSAGFGSQLMERSRDIPITGAGTYERKPDPVTS